MGSSMKTIIITSSILGIVVILYLKNMDYYINTYDNKEEVLFAKSIKRGWIPKNLPNSAYQIREKHNIDTNFVKGCFYYNDIDEEIFLETFKTYNNQFFFNDYKFNINTKNNYACYTNK